MGGWLSRFVDVRAGENSLVLKSTATLAGLIGAHTMLETARDALFLGRLPPSKLTFVYALLALFALIAARANAAFVQRFGRRNALVFTLLGSAYGTTVIYLLPPSPVIVFGLYLWSGLLGSVVVVQFWMLAGELFSVSQGKRVFGLIAAGGVLGAVLGAGVAALALRYMSTTFSVHHLLPMGAGLFLLTAMLVTTFDVDKIPRRRPSPGRSIFSLNRWIGNVEVFQRYPYLIRLAVLIGISTTAVLATDYLFKSVAARTMDADELGPFFAGYYVVLNGIALITQLFIAGALVRRTGVLIAFSVLPTLLLTGGIALLAFSQLAVVAFPVVLLTKGADGALRHSLHRISSELLWLPLPDHVRAESKAFIDTVVVRGSQAGVAGGLLLLATFGYDKMYTLGTVVIVCSCAWLFAAFRLHRPYLDLFRSALHHDGPDAMRGTLNLNIESIAMVVEALSSRDADRAIAAIDLLEANKQQHVIPALILYHESPEVLIRALDVIALPNRRDWPALAERLLEDERPPVRVAAVRALAHNGRLEPIRQRLLDIDPRVRAQAAFWLAREDPNPPETHLGVQQIVGMPTDAGRLAKASLLSAIATAGDPRWTPVVLELCGTDELDPVFLEPLVAAMRKVEDPSFIPYLIERLRHRTARPIVRDAIVELGEPALDALEQALRNRTTPRGIRRHIPSVIWRFRNQRAADTLLERLDSERNGLVRFKVLHALGKMVSETTVTVDRRTVEGHLHRTLVEYLRLLSHYVPVKEGVDSASGGATHSGGLLTGLLQDKLTQALDRAFRYLNLIHRQEDLRGVTLAVRSADRKLRGQALEYIDTLTLDATNAELRTLFRLVVDDLPDADRVARATAFIPDPPRSYHRALSKLIRDPDDAIASLAAYHALMLRTSGLTSDVLTVSEQRPTLSNLEKIVEHLINSDEVPSLA